MPLQNLNFKKNAGKISPSDKPYPCWVGFLPPTCILKIKLWRGINYVNWGKNPSKKMWAFLDKNLALQFYIDILEFPLWRSKIDLVRSMASWCVQKSSWGVELPKLSYLKWTYWRSCTYYGVALLFTRYLTE